MLLDTTAPGLRQQQASLESALHIIRARFDPRDAAVVTLVGQDPYRFMMYYLPEYAVLRLDSRTRSVLTAQGHRQGSWMETTDCLFSGGEVHHAVWVVSMPSEPGTVPEEATLVSASDGPGPFQVWDVETTPAPREYLGFNIRVPCGAV
jgi:hypothetical protein